MADRDGIVLITGGTGHLGFAVVKHALQQGWKVRLAVRSQEKADLLDKTRLIQELPSESGQVSFVKIPNFTTAGAFDEAVQGAKYIIHVASPLATRAPENPDDWHEFFVEPAVQGTVGILEAAAKTNTVRRIVITSSVVTLQPLSVLHGDQAVYSAESRMPNLDAPYPNSFVAYVASKVAAFNRTEEWIREQQPQFDVINIHPSFVLGRDDLADSAERFQTSTNALPLNIALGREGPLPAAPNNWNYVDDTAKIHVMSLDPAITGNQSFIVSSDGQDGMTWASTKKIVADKFAEAVANGLLPNNGNLDTVIARLDTRKTEDTFGIKFSTYEESVVSLVDHYLEVVQASKKAE